MEPPLQPEVMGSFGVWVATPVNLDFFTSDGMSGVEEYEYSVDGGAWQEAGYVVPGMARVTIDAPADHANDGVHWIWFYSVDAVGNVEPSWKSCTVEIDVLGTP